MQVRSPLRAIAIMMRLWSHPLKTNELLVEEEQSASFWSACWIFVRRNGTDASCRGERGSHLLCQLPSAHCSGIWGLTRRLKKEVILVALSAELGLGLVPSLTPLSPNTCRLFFISYPARPSSSCYAGSWASSCS